MDAIEASLRAAIFAAPDDDAPRAVYADWLIERGDPLGDFIALQLRSRTATTKRIDALAARLRDRLLAPFGRDVDPASARFERGFLAEVVVRSGARPRPEWATLHTVRGWVPSTPMPALRAARDLHDDALRRLARMTPRPPIAHLGVAHLYWRAFEELPKLLRRLPALAHVELERDAFYDAVTPRDIAPEHLDAVGWLPPRDLAQLTLPSHPRHLAAWLALPGPRRLVLTPHGESSWRIDVARLARGCALAVAPHDAITPTLDDVDLLVDTLAALPADSIASLEVTGVAHGRWRAIARRNFAQRVLARQPRIDPARVSGYAR